MLNWHALIHQSGGVGKAELVGMYLVIGSLLKGKVAVVGYFLESLDGCGQ